MSFQFFDQILYFAIFHAEDDVQTFRIMSSSEKITITAKVDHVIANADVRSLHRHIIIFIMSDLHQIKSDSCQTSCRYS